MGLRSVAEQDLAFILEEDESGFRWPIQLISPTGVSENLFGFSNDIAQAIDPETGQLVSGRTASVALRISPLYSTGIGLPRGIANANSKPWVVKFDDINGKAHTFKIQHTDPDRAIGLVVCMLEIYEGA